MMRLTVLLLTAMLASASFAAPLAGVLDEAQMWRAYKQRFIGESGRVIDNANGNISHSEGQGFAMVIAVGANDAKTFAKLWSFTKDELAVRKDNLLAWKWTPGLFGGTVTDENNATDGDILIAWALLEAHEAGFGDYRAEAFKILKDVRSLILPSVSGPIVLPATKGFDVKAQGALVINLSYWVFPAFRRLEELTGDPIWSKLFESGESLIAAASDNPGGLPADWTALTGSKATVASNFPSEFSYNAVRIPLYLAWAYPGSETLTRFEKNWVQNGELGRIDVTTGKKTGPLQDAGYRAIGAVVNCVKSGQKFPSSLRRNLDQLYYPASLHLLSIMTIKQVHPSCW